MKRLSQPADYPYSSMRKHYGFAIQNTDEIYKNLSIAQKLKSSEPDCFVTWFAFEKSEAVLRNPYVDQIVAFEGSAKSIHTEIPRLKAERSWSGFFTSALSNIQKDFPAKVVTSLPQSDNRSSKRILLGQLGLNGDCLHATTLARQIKHDYPNCHLTWAVSTLCRGMVEGNPFVDEIWEIPAANWDQIVAAWYLLEQEVHLRVKQGEFDEVFLTQVSPINYQNYDGTTRASLFRAYPKPITVPIQNILRLRDDEVAKVRDFAEQHNLLKRAHVILFECTSSSSQSFVTPAYALYVAQKLLSRLPDCSIILSSNIKIPAADVRIIDGSTLSLRENAELTKYCTLFIGCSSGITQTALTDWAKPLPMIQLLLASTSVYASLAHDLEYWGYSSEQILEMTDSPPDQLIECVYTALTQEFSEARCRFHQKIPINFNFYLTLIRTALIEKGQYVKAARALLYAIERYGCHYQLKAFVQTELIAKADIDSSVVQQLIAQIQQNQVDLKQANLASVVVPWWDHSEFLELWERNLEHLPNTEIIFIDNGSGPVGKAALEKFCSRHDIKLIRNEENRGFAAANNQGIAVATSEYILHLNNDVEILNLPMTYLCSQAGEGIAGAEKKRNELNCTYVEGWALCIKRSRLLALNGWCEDYGPGYWDDVDLCHRLQLAGYSLTFIPELHQMIRHITNATGRDGRIDQIPLHIRNRGIFLEKYYQSFPKIVVDGIFFQLYQTGIARVWRSLLEEWADNGFAKYIVVLDRAGTAPKIPGIRYRFMAPYDYNKTDADRGVLQRVCDEEGADLFISSYYTTPLSTLSVFMGYDMIPEVVGADESPMWREKHYAIQHASAHITISDNTARDLVKFFPHISPESVTVALCGVKRSFLPASLEEINSFRTKYGILKPYFIMVGVNGDYKNKILFFKAFSRLFNKQGFDIVCAGSGGLLEAELRDYTSGSVVHMLQLSDEELSAAYSGAVALAYPSKYEGFGLPILEAIACGCPVITCPNASIPEVAGKAALYVNDEDIDGLANALCDVQKPNVRNSLIAAGLEQAKKFSWSKMAKIVSSTLIDTTLLLNLKDINLIVFPDWSQPEEPLCFDLEQVIRAIATHPDRSQMTLLVEIGNFSEEDAALILSSVTMNLFLQEDLDVSEGPEISLVGQLGEIQWEALLPRIHARISLENENKQVIARVRAENIPSCELDSVSNEQAAQLKPGIWDLTGHSEMVYFNRGMALQKQGNFAEAMIDYQKALEIKPDFAEARSQFSITRYQNQIVLKGYQFTQDWFSWNIPTWEQHLKQFINLPTLNILEIGSWEGRSTCWLLDNILTHKDNKITCIDTFEGSLEHTYDNNYLQSIEGRFDFNIAKTGVPEKVEKIVGKSHEVMRTLPLNSYELVYIDGSHLASDVLEDAVLAWQLVKIGGFIVFDDYPFAFTQNPGWNTRIGIDAFMITFSDKFKVIHKGYQVIIEKTQL